MTNVPKNSQAFNAPAADLIHVVAIRQTVELRVEVLDGARVRLGLYRASPSAPDDLVLTSGFALTLGEARELQSALSLAAIRLETEA